MLNAAITHCANAARVAGLSLMIAAVLLTSCTSTYTTGNTTARVTQTEVGTTVVGNSEKRGPGSRSDTSFLIQQTIFDILPGHILLATPVDGVFVGVSNYGADEREHVTPGQAIGAALAYSVFYQAEKETRSTSEAATDFATDSRLAFLGDLWLDPTDETWHARQVSVILHALPGVEVFEYSSVFALPQHHLWQYLRSGQRLTKSAILAAARAQVARLSSYSGNDPPVDIFYIASHGKIGSDGQRYLRAEDSRGGDLRTWVSYQELLDLFKIPGMLAADRPISAIVILDTCLTKDRQDSEVKPLQIPPGVLVVSGAAPGQDSWQWTQISQIKRLGGSISELGVEDRLSPKDLTYYTMISVLPVALAKSIRSAEIRARTTDCADGHPPSQVGISGTQFVRKMAQLVPTLDSDRHYDIPDGHVNAIQTVEINVSEATVGAFAFEQIVASGQVGSEPQDSDLFAVPCEP